MNDPFEGRLGQSLFRDMSVQHIGMEPSMANDNARFLEGAHQDKNNDRYRLISFVEPSEQSNQHDPLFWALYADRHKGVRLSFSFEPINATEAAVPVGRLRRVKYQKKPHQYDGKVGDDILFFKADYWSHENEWRWICPTSALRSEIFSERPKQARDFYEWPDLVLEEIIFGWKCSKKDKAKICESITGQDPSAAPRRFQADPDISSYKMVNRPV
ncbi:MAG TPA: DUF2971 domain-containing protein [Verrucomicrobiota bacterium]|nr:DUF2971 domain-containing protein [Verrucomicrobiota bacterium]